MTEISSHETILSRQLKMIADADIKDVVITTGYYDGVLVKYCQSLELPIHFTFVNNPIYDQTNYIYSIYCAREQLQNEDIILMHGDLVFEVSVLDDILSFPHSCMKVSSTIPLPQKDFKAVIHNGLVEKVGVEFFTDAMEAQALYKLNRDDWKIWLDKIIEFCETDRRKCYAEVALNEISDTCKIYAYDVGNRLCTEIDTPEDLAVVKARVAEVESRSVYMCFSADLIHSGHIAIIKKATKLGRLTVGVLSDEAVASYKAYPFVPFEERKTLMENIVGVAEVIEQKTLSYAENLRTRKPTYVVHGDDWKSGTQKSIRDEVVEILAEYGGTLVEFPYAKDEKYEKLELSSKK
jgi:phosphoenolpyruvate phosphomutase